MSSKEFILERLSKNIKTKYDLPDLDSFNAIKYTNPLEKFIEMSKIVGGNAIFLENKQNINELIKLLYPNAKNIASNLKEITISTINPDEINSGKALNGTDLGIIQGDFGVAENGCIWIPQNVKEKAIYFISEYLVILLDKKNIVNNMHEAYEKLIFPEVGFGVFISGPSKTADIEQTLVIGAHGARGLTVILY